MATGRAPYTLQEDRKIIRYILDGDYGRSIKGDGLWKKMEMLDVVPNRTWQSLKNRYIKTIAADLGRPEYQITPEERTELKADMSLGGKTATRVNLRPATNELEERQKENKTEKPHKVAKKEEEFYSLDMNWSDDDTD